MCALGLLDNNVPRYFTFGPSLKIDPFSCQCGEFANVHLPNVVHMVLVGLKFRPCDTMYLDAVFISVCNPVTLYC